MNEDTVSAALDGEASPEELAALLASPAFEEHARQLARHAAIGQAMRGGAIAAPDFAERVMAACQARPAAAVVPPRRWSAGGRRGRLRRLVAGAGIAMAGAAAALAAVVIAPQWLGVPGDPGPAPAVVQAAGTPAPAAARPVAVAARSGGTRERGALDRHPRLASYVISYSNARGVSGVSGPLGYARLAAYVGNQPGEAGGP